MIHRTSPRTGLWAAFIFGFVVLSGLSAAPGPALAKPEPIDNSTPAMTLIQSIKLGWNMGNSLDAYSANVSSETAWGNAPATQTLLDKVAAAGFGAVRIPVTWMGHIGTEAEGYALDPGWLARVAEVVGYAHQAGLKVIINLHHDGADTDHWLSIKQAAADPVNEKRIRGQLVAVWTQIATYFSNHGDYLLFELWNELHDGSWGWGANRNDKGKQYGILNSWAQTLVTTIRQTGGNNSSRLLVIPGYVTDPDLTLNNLVIPQDSAKDRLVVTVHYYTPTDFAIQHKTTTWGHRSPSANNSGQEGYVTSLFDDLKATFIDEGVPLIVGEYGAVRPVGTDKFRLYYLEYVTKAFHDAGIVPFFWDNGSAGTGNEAFGLFNRATGEPLSGTPAVLDVLRRAAGVTPTEAGYSLESIYAQAPSQ